jgi:WS/DGAT/MGAT family acyltransferase
VRQHHRPDPPPLPDALTLAVDALFDRALDQIRLNERIALSLLDPARAIRSARSIARALWAAGPYFAVPAQTTPWRMRLHGPDRWAWQSLPFDEVRAVASTLGGTINDVGLTLVAGGLRRYLEGLGERTDGRVLRAGLPVNVRREEHANTLGNRISFMLAGLPVGVRDPRERFRTIHREVTELKKQRQAAGVEELMERLGDLPPALHALTGRTLTMPNNLANLICTNVPGPLQPLYLQGHRMLHHYAWVPISWRMGLCVAMMSYNTGMYFAVTADHETPGDIGVITRGIREDFDELRAATIVPQPYRRFVPPTARPAPPEPAVKPPVPLGDEALMTWPGE